MKHLVTGVAGFVGSNLARKLLDAGHQVTGIDNMSCGYYSNKTIYLIISLVLDLKSATLEVILVTADLLTQYGTWEQEVNYGSVGDNINEAIDVNVKGTLNMLKVAKESLAKHFYFADTSAEYDSFDDEQYYPTAEWMSPNTITPMGYYAITKMAASQFVRSFGKMNDIGTTLFSIY